MNSFDAFFVYFATNSLISFDALVSFRKNKSGIWILSKLQFRMNNYFSSSLTSSGCVANSGSNDTNIVLSNGPNENKSTVHMKIFHIFAQMLISSDWLINNAVRSTANSLSRNCVMWLEPMKRIISPKLSSTSRFKNFSLSKMRICSKWYITPKKLVVMYFNNCFLEKSPWGLLLSASSDRRLR